MTKVLIADSDPDVVDVLREGFEAAGCECTTAFDGRTALARIRSDRPDLVILELELPEVDGLEICRRLRDMPGGPMLRPLVILTARNGEFDERLSATVGADDFVRKPFSLIELVDRARRLLQWHGRWSPPGPPADGDTR
jgi:DNA-binding response OmpR family regulator